MNKADVGAPLAATRFALAGVIAAKAAPLDAWFAAIADALAADGLVVAGLVQDSGAGPGGRSEMHVRELSSGARRKISEDRGADARGCRLDWAALTDAAQAVETSLERAPAALLVNRFGAAEAEGKGLRTAIETAIERGLPTLVGVRAGYADAWAAFHGGLAETLAMDEDAALAWIRAAR